MSSVPPSHERPRLAITVGDVAGVGPELALKCAAMDIVEQNCVPLIVGPAKVLAKVAAKLKLACPEVISPKAIPARQRPAIINIGEVDSQNVSPGTTDHGTGLASYAAVDFAIQQALTKNVDGIVTGPIQKEAWHAAGIKFPGHTELLADRAGTSDFCMMLTGEMISCVLATIHIPLADVPAALTIEKVLRAIRLGGDALSRRLGSPARVTVCGLNPHAGEKGLFSHGEETNIIEPAIQKARDLGVTVTGPVPPDTAFTPAMRERTDVYVAMYHDQGLIPLKALSFDDAVNVTLGLPIVRTSVDHGTALDLAWQGKANHQSMLAAIEMAIDLA